MVDIIIKEVKMKRKFTLIVLLLLCVIMPTTVFGEETSDVEVYKIVDEVAKDGMTGTVGYQFVFEDEKSINSFLELNDLEKTSVMNIPSVYNASKSYNYTIFKVRIDVSWYANGQNGYIMHMYGTYDILDSAFSCRWTDSTSMPSIHTLDLYYYSNYTNGYKGFMCSYNPFTSTVRFSEY